MGRRKINLPMEQVISEYESGMTLKKLGEKYGVSDTTIRNRLIEAGVQIRSQGGSFVLEGRNEKIAEMYQQGKSLREVGDEFGLTGEAIRQILKKMGVDARGRLVAKTELDEAEFEELKVMLEEGITIVKVAKHFEVNTTIISDLMKKEGLVRKYVPRVSWDYKKAEEDYLNGVPLTEIARRHGVPSYTYLVEVMKRLGHEPRGTTKDLPMEQVISEYESGMSMVALGKKYDVSHITIRRRLVEAGVQIRKISYRVELSVEQIISEYESGMSLKALGKKCGVSRNTIRERLVEAGVQIRTPHRYSKKVLPMKQIISEYESGMSMVALGKKYGVADNTIRTRLIEMELI